MAMNAEPPEITHSDLCRLLASPAEQPVLSIDLYGELEVGPRAWASDQAIIMSKGDLLRYLGEDFTDADSGEYLDELQLTVDQVFGYLKEQEDVR